MKWIIITLFLFSLISCDVKQKEIKGKPKVVCTTTILADAVKHIAGDKFEIEVLMGPGVDPHEFVPRQGDMEKLEEADIIVYHGLLLEGRLTETMEKLEKQNRRVINVSKVFGEIDLLHSDGSGCLHEGGDTHAHGEMDPHVWHDAEMWSKSVLYLAEELEKIDYNNSKLNLTLKLQGKVYASELLNFHEELIESYASVPDSFRILVTAHGAFRYLGEAYGFTNKSLQGISTAAKFGVKDVTDLATYICDNGIHVLFLETSVPDKNLQAVIENCESRNHKVIIGGKLYSDALGDKNSGADTYIEMMKSNMQTIINAIRKIP